MKLQQLKYVIAVADAGSINEASKQLFVTQPSLSAQIKELETQLGFEIFKRTNKGADITREGNEFVAYAKMVIEQADNLERRFFKNDQKTQVLSISMQHYAFAVAALINHIDRLGLDSYDYSIRECRTSDVIDDVKSFKSEIGILMVSKFNQNVMMRFFKETRMEFVPLFTSTPHVFLSAAHPLAEKKTLTLEDLAPYTYLGYQQNKTDSFYFSEEILSEMDHEKRILVDDRATIFNLIKGLDGYSIGTNMTTSILNGHDIVSVPLEADEELTIGYIKLRSVALSNEAETFLEVLAEEIGDEKHGRSKWNARPEAKQQ